MSATREIRPSAKGTDQILTGSSNTPTISAPAEIRHESAELDTPAADYFRNSYAVLVRGKSVRRHLYFNLPAADRTVKRALERGDKAELILVRLVPVDARQLDQGEASE